MFQDVSRDGRRVLMLKGGAADEQDIPQPQIDLVLGWTAELRNKIGGSAR